MCVHACVCVHLSLFVYYVYLHIMCFVQTHLLIVFKCVLPSVIQLIVEEELVGEDQGSHGEHRDVGVSARHFVHSLETSDWRKGAEWARRHSVRV